MRKKLSTGKHDHLDTVALQTPTSTVKQEERILELERENNSLQGKLDEIADIVECDDPECSAEDHLAEIEEVVTKDDGGTDK